MINVINQNMRNNMSANKGRHLTLFNGAAFVKAASICQTKMAEGDSYIMAEQIQEWYWSKQISQSCHWGVSEIKEQNNCHYQRLYNFIHHCRLLYPCEWHLQSCLASDHTINKKQNKTKPSVTVWGWLDYTCTCTCMHVPAWSFLETHCLTYTKYWTWAKLWKWQSYNKNILLVIDPCIISMDRIGENQHENVKDTIQVEHIWIIIEKNLVSWPWSVHVSVCKISCGFPIIFDIWWAFVIFNIFSHCCIFIQVSN